MIDGVRAYQVQASIEEDYAKIDGINFRRDKFGSFTMDGSLHRYHNKGKGNADDYRFTDLKETMKRLYNELEINPEITRISRVEFGVNIILPINAEIVTDSVILFRNDSGESKTIGRFFEFADYEFKIYRKDANILRVEVKVKNLRHLKQKKVYVRTLDDLLNENVLNGLKKILIQTFEDCMIINVPENVVSKLNDADGRKYAEYTNPLYWNKIRRNKKKNFSREKKRCDEFIKSIGGTDLKDELLIQIRDKCDYLLNYSDLKSVEFFKENNQQMNNRVSSFSSLDNSMKNTTTTTKENVIRCAGCGAIINNPRKGQRYCSAKVIGYENAHRCRNNISNAKNNIQRSIRNVLSIPLMFDLRDIIEKEKYNIWKLYEKNY
jgi:hypothetical protein